MTRATRPRRRVAVLAIVLTVGVAACGLPEDDEPRVVAAEDAPIDLSPTTAMPETTAGRGADEVELFFVDPEANRLRRVTRAVDAITEEAAITALLQGRVEGDPPGLTSAIPPGTELIAIDRVESLLVLDLGPDGPEGIQGVQAEAQTRAFAQLVYTATALDGVGLVQFRVEGVPIDARTDGPAKAEVNRTDYASLAPASG